MGRLIIPPPSAAHPSRAAGFTPTKFYSSTQLDNFSSQCGFGANETLVGRVLMAHRREITLASKGGMAGVTGEDGSKDQKVFHNASPLVSASPARARC